MENSEFERKIIEVCDSCFCASCWFGLFFCDDHRSASTVLLTVKELRAMNDGRGNGENEHYWSDAYMEKGYGCAAPHGFNEVESEVR